MTLVKERVGHATARRAMIDSQLRVSGVNDPAILAAFASVAREDFVPAGARAIAYMDRAVPLGDGTVLAPALTHGQMLTVAEVSPADHVLVIGQPGTYLAALVAQLGAKVSVAAPDADWGFASPYSLVLIDGAIAVAPPALVAVLADHGRVVTGLVERGVMRLATGRRVLGDLVLTMLAEADFAALPAFAAKKSWSF
ncbi:protein-L-isoaspartate O-methyltransferase [Novosphingobium sp.]|uniref:protein-L-isoaspartate O-methyltransferase family protein n=1 Tax=Novosphingobium sp. TaxID=1874826 RepID=UPI00333F729A